jgi:hypothetical protein
MPDKTQEDLIKRASEILDRYDDPAAQDELTDEMLRRGIIDARGQVVFPVNGQSRDPKANDHSS